MYPDVARVKREEKGKKRKKDSGIDGLKENPGEPRVLSIPALAAPTNLVGGNWNCKTLYLSMGRGLVLKGRPRSGFCIV